MRRDHLWQRGHQWYLRLAIPRVIREKFKGKPFIAEPLGPDYTSARTEADRRIADYQALFANAPRMTIEAVQSEIEAIKEQADGRKSVANLPMLLSEWRRLEDQQFADLAAGRLKEATVNWYPLGSRMADAIHAAQQAAAPISGAPVGETVSQAAETWFGELARAGVRPQTLDGHRLRVKAFVDHAGDIPLSSITRAAAADFLSAVANGRSNRTTNNYQQTLSGLYNNARNRGRVSGDNPFEGQRRKVVAEKREAFTAGELQKIFAALPTEIKPARHSPETALPWAVRIAAFTGMRLEEVAQLSVADIKTVGTNGGTVVGFNIHNGGNNHLKNNSSARVIPVHSELVRAGLLKYIKALPKDGMLFAGLKRRASKGNKVGARLGELFRKLLLSLDMKRPGLCFHSLRHGVAHALEAAAVSQTDAARVLGHTVGAESYGTYSSGPGLKRLAAVVEEIGYGG